jgi:alanyl-tRNA synthetase
LPGLLNHKKELGSASYPGEKAFKLYDTFGLPLDFITDVLRDQGLELKEEDFNRALEEQRTRAKASWKGAHKESANPVYAKLAQTFKTEPDFYFGTKTRTRGSKRSSPSKARYRS